MDILKRIDRFISLKGGNTPRAYRTVLRLLAEFFELKSDTSQFGKLLKSLTTVQCSDFLYWLRCRKGQDGTRASDNTIFQRLAILRRLYRHLVAMEEVQFNPWLPVAEDIPTRRKKQKRPTKLVPFNKIPFILDIPKPNTKAGIRDRAMLALLFGGGLRIGELFSLCAGDVKTTPSGVPFLHIRDAKSGVDQYQPLPEWAWERFSILLSQRKNEFAGHGDPLFIFYYKNGQPGVRWSVETARRRYRKYCKKAGVENAAPHSARATAASWLLSQGFSEEEVARFLRHSNTRMVKTYDKRIRGPEDNAGLKIDYKGYRQL